MTSDLGWQLRSHDQRELARWTVRRVHSARGVVLCDVELSGRYLGALLESTHDPKDQASRYRLELCGLEVRLEQLDRLRETIRQALALPPIALQELAVDCALGELFDQQLRLRLGQSREVLSGGLPVATLELLAGRLRAVLAFAVDADGIETLLSGLDRVLSGATGGPT